MSVNFTPTPVVAGIAPTAAQLNASGAGAWTDIQAAWDTYTPTWSAATTPPTLGDGTLVGKWRRVGKTFDFAIRLTIGSTTTVGSGIYGWTLPVTTLLAAEDAVGVGQLFDVSGSSRFGRNAFAASTTVVRLVDQAAATVVGHSTIAWAPGDIISIRGSGIEAL